MNPWPDLRSRFSHGLIIWASRKPNVVMFACLLESGDIMHLATDLLPWSVPAVETVTPFPRSPDVRSGTRPRRPPGGRTQRSDDDAHRGKQDNKHLCSTLPCISKRKALSSRSRIFQVGRCRVLHGAPTPPRARHARRRHFPNRRPEGRTLACGRLVLDKPRRRPQRNLSIASTYPDFV